MNTFASKGDLALEATATPASKIIASPFWKISLLVAINFLSVMLAIPIIYFPARFSRETWTELWLLLVGLYHGQLFLLAYWKTFGGTPRIGRRFLLTMLTICGATPVTAMFAHGAFIALQRELTLHVRDFGPIILSLIVVWSLHVIFLVATCVSPIVINFSELSNRWPSTPSPFTFVDALKLICLTLVPVSLMFSLYWLDHVFAGMMLPSVAISVLFTGIALTPAALLLVTDTHFLWKFVGVSAWASLTIVLFLNIPRQWAPESNVTAHLAAVGVVFLNLLALRAMGLRRLANETPPPVAGQGEMLA